MKFPFIILVFNLLSLSLLASQPTTSEVLFAKQKLLNSDIQYAQNLINKYNSKGIESYYLVNAQIYAQNHLLDNMIASQEELDKESYLLQEQYSKLNSKKSELTKRYAKIVKYAYRKKFTQGSWAYLFSSKSLIDALNRWKLIKQAEGLLKNEKDKRSKYFKSLDQLKAKLDMKYAKIEVLLKNQEDEILQLQEMLDLHTQIEDQLKLEAPVLLQLAKQNNELSTQLDDKIYSTIQQNLSNSQNSKYDLSHQMGQLSWPLEKSLVLQSFGTKYWAFIDDYQFQSSGFTLLSSTKSSKILASATGEVVSILPTNDGKYTIILSHGNYHTVYHKVTNYTAQMGQIVKKNQPIAELKYEATILNAMEFQIWENTEKRDPEIWLTKK